MDKVLCPHASLHKLEAQYFLVRLDDQEYWCSCGCTFMYDSANMQCKVADFEFSDSLISSEQTRIVDVQDESCFPIACPRNHDKAKTFFVTIKKEPNNYTNKHEQLMCICSCGTRFLYHIHTGRHEVLTWVDSLQSIDCNLERARTISIVHELMVGRHLTIKDVGKIGMAVDMTIGILMTNMETNEQTISHLNDMTLRELNILLNRKNIWFPIPI